MDAVGKRVGRDLALVGIHLGAGLFVLGLVGLTLGSATDAADRAADRLEDADRLADQASWLGRLLSAARLSETAGNELREATPAWILGSAGGGGAIVRLGQLVIVLLTSSRP